MARPPGTTYRRVILALLAVCGVAISVIVCSMLAKDGRLRLPFFAEPAEAGDPTRLVVRVTEFTKCGDELRDSERYHRDDVASVLSGLPPVWTVVKSDEMGALVKRQVDDYCDTHRRVRLITFHRGHVCVFRGEEPDPRFLLTERPDIREVDLPERDRAFLRNGHIIRAAPEVPDTEVAQFLEREVNSSLEGLTEH